MAAPDLPQCVTTLQGKRGSTRTLATFPAELQLQAGSLQPLQLHGVISPQMGDFTLISARVPAETLRGSTALPS